MLETSFGYTGVNIKIKFNFGDTDTVRLNMLSGSDWKRDSIDFSKYLSELQSKEYIKVTNKNRYNTFMVFYSGEVIMSGMQIDYMRDIYTKFVKLICDNRHIIEEKLF